MSESQFHSAAGDPREPGADALSASGSEGTPGGGQSEPEGGGESGNSKLGQVASDV